MIDRRRLRDLLYEYDADDIDMPFWDACERHEFLLYRCQLCGRAYWPGCMCIEDGNKDMKWVQASGRGAVHTYAIVRHAYSPEMLDQVPYNVCVIKLEEGPFFHSNVIDCPPEELRSGLLVEVVFRAHSSGLTLPLFRRVHSDLV